MTVIGVVGPCSAGKSTLIQGLKNLGYTARHIAQEHSFVPDMWQRITDPDILIYLDVSYQISMFRRQLDLTEAEFEVQKERLLHSREHADFYLNTNDFTPDEVLRQVRVYLERRLS